MASTLTLEKNCSFHRREYVSHMILSPRDAKMETPRKKAMILSPREAKKNATYKEAKCELVGFDALPEFLRDNEFILNYYRSEWPWKQTLLSIFGIHNETLNIWTHLIGFFIFLALTVAIVPLASQPGSNSSIGYIQNTTLPAAEMLPSSSSWYLAQVLANYLPERISQVNQTSILSIVEDDVQAQSLTRWPFYAYLFGVMFCLFTSSACHLLSCHSTHCAYTMLRLDYTGISTLIVTSFYPLVYYTFFNDPFVRNLYISFITAFGVATVLVSLVPVFQTPEFRPVRALLFFCMGVSGLVPIMHKMIAFGHDPVAVVTTGYELVMGAFYGLGVIVYATRVPERWLPGKFDLVGHSHQLFHVLVIAGAYTHYLASVMYLNWREMEVC